MKSFLPVNTRPLAAALLAVILAGCGRDDVKVYKVDARDGTATPAPGAAASEAMPMTMPAGLPTPDDSSQPRLKYTLPSGWKEKPLTQMRVASFEVAAAGKLADVSVIPLGGMSGGDLANVNRWRGQIGQAPIADAELAKLAEKVVIAGQPGDLYDLAGTNPGSGEAQRILGAILHDTDTVWYFKMSGEAGLAENQKTNFIAFLKSVEFQKPAPPAAMDMTQLPPSHPKIELNLPADGNAVIEMDTNSPSKPTWTIPADWKEGQLAQFLVAKFIIQKGDVTAAVNVSSLAGDGGGLLPNLNRWRSQLGQPPLSDSDLAKLATMEASGTKATLVQINGTDPRSNQPASLVGVVLPLDGQTWFYKLMGDPTIVAQQKDALIKFVQSAHYPVGP